MGMDFVLGADNTIARGQAWTYDGSTAVAVTPFSTAQVTQLIAALRTVTIYPHVALKGVTATNPTASLKFTFYNDNLF